MDQDPPDTPEDFSDVERRLAAARPGFTKLELDKIKLRALAGASRPRRTGGQLKGIALRSRVLRISVSLVAFAGTAIGGIAAFDVLANAASSQYGTGSATCSSGTTGYFNITAGPTHGLESNSANLGSFTVTLFSCSTNSATTPNALDGNKGVSMPVFLTCTTTAPTPTSGGAQCTTSSSFALSPGGSSVKSVLIPATSSTATFYFGYAGTAAPDVVASGPNNAGGFFPEIVPGYQTETIDHLVLAGTATAVPGVADNLTLTAQTASNATDTAFSGSQAVTFAGAHTSPGGGASTATAPTVTDNTATAEAFGASTPITFASGVASTATLGASGQAAMKLYDSESASVTASANGFTTPGLAVTVAHPTLTGITDTTPGTSGGTPQANDVETLTFNEPMPVGGTNEIPSSITATWTRTTGNPTTMSSSLGTGWSLGDTNRYINSGETVTIATTATSSGNTVALKVGTITNGAQLTGGGPGTTAGDLASGLIDAYGNVVTPAFSVANVTWW